MRARSYLPHVTLVLFAVIPFALTGCDSTATPTASIMGEEQVEPGDLVRLTTTGSSSGDKAWSVIPDSAAKKMYVVDDGNTVLFSSRTEGQYVFILAVVKNNKVDLITHVLRNGTGGIPDDPTPGPDDPDDGGGSDWLSNLTRNAKMIAEQHLSGHSTEISAMAGSMEAVIATVSAGIYKTTREAREAMREANREALGDAADEDRWTAFSAELKVGLDKYAADGKLETLDGLVSAWRAVANGLRQAR